MPGVDILAVEEVAVESAFCWLAFWIVVGLFGVLGFVISAVNIWNDEINVGDGVFITLMCLSCGTLLGILSGVIFETPTKYETQYKVTVSDEVSMTEFLERYEIIETEGKIYTVKEK